MTREHKFRVWDKENGQMLYSGFCIIPTSPHWSATKYFTPKIFDTPEWFDCTVFDWADANILCGNYEIMGYTGLKDSKGKPIYEGDEVSRFEVDVDGNKLESRYTVCFGLYDNGQRYDMWVGGNGWYLANEMFFRAGKREEDDWESKVEHLLDADDLEVIGNIHQGVLTEHENPDLLEVEPDGS